MNGLAFSQELGEAMASGLGRLGIAVPREVHQIDALLHLKQVAGSRLARRLAGMCE